MKNTNKKFSKNQEKNKEKKKYTKNYLFLKESYRFLKKEEENYRLFL
jgi:hypothetical protein